jgi:hypothetical protein
VDRKNPTNRRHTYSANLLADLQEVTFLTLFAFLGLFFLKLISATGELQEFLSTQLSMFLSALELP